jgi:hypothetical protein
MLTKEYQEYKEDDQEQNGAVVDANTLYVQYNYDTSDSNGEYTNGLRPTSVRYPNGRGRHAVPLGRRLNHRSPEVPAVGLDLTDDTTGDLPAVLGHYARSMIGNARQLHERGQDAAARHLICIALDVLFRGLYAAEFDQIGSMQHGLPWRAGKLRSRLIIDRATLRRVSEY